jgi:hypothetical protein
MNGYHINVFWSEEDGAWLPMSPTLNIAPRMGPPRSMRCDKSRSRWPLGWTLLGRRENPYPSPGIDRQSMPQNNIVLR